MLIISPPNNFPFTAITAGYNVHFKERSWVCFVVDVVVIPPPHNASMRAHGMCLQRLLVWCVRKSPKLVFASAKPIFGKEGGSGYRAAQGKGGQGGGCQHRRISSPGSHTPHWQMRPRGWLSLVSICPKGQITEHQRTRIDSCPPAVAERDISERMGDSTE